MSFTPVVIGSGLAAYSFLERTRAEQVETLQNTAQSRRATAVLQERMPGIETSEDLMDDRQMLRIVLGAFGLEEDIDNRAFIQGVLDSDLSDPRSLANRLSDKRYLSLARTFGFASEAGPQALNAAAREADALGARLADIRSAEDLMADPALLRAALDAFGLPARDAGNAYLLEQVFASDPDDPTSFVNRLGNPGYAQLVAELDFETKSGNRDSLIGFADLVAQSGGRFQTAQDVLDAPEVVAAALDIFGLSSPLIDEAFLERVLVSDLTDPASFANTRSDPLWATFSRAFGIGEKIARPESFAARTSPLDRIVAAAGGRDAPFASAEDFANDPQVSVAAAQFFDLPTDVAGFNRIRLVLDSDAESPTSLRNLLDDPRYDLLARAVDITPPETGWRPPAGFVEGILDQYMTRQFEIRIGEVDPDMRLALGFEREMGALLGNAGSNNARWYGIMASEPLRTVFEKALNLPDSFGTLDLERQLTDFQTRAEARYGTADIARLATGDLAGQVVRDFLTTGAINAGVPGGPTSAASLILGSIERSFG